MPDLRSIVRTPLLTPSPLQRYQTVPARTAIRDDLVLTATGGPGPDWNFVTVFGPEAPERVLALADDFFGDEPYSVLVEVASAEPLEAALQAAGWELDEDEPAMVLQPLPTAPPPPDGLEIRRVSTEAELHDFFTISGTARRRVPSLAAALDPDIALLVGYLAGEPVATARLSIHGTVGDINGVVTAEAFRRRGIGTALTWAAVDVGRECGCDAVTLTATEMGFPVYRRMGFVPVCSYRTYLPPSGEAG